MINKWLPLIEGLYIEPHLRIPFFMPFVFFTLPPGGKEAGHSVKRRPPHTAQHLSPGPLVSECGIERWKPKPWLGVVPKSKLRNWKFPSLWLIRLCAQTRSVALVHCTSAPYSISYHVLLSLPISFVFFSHCNLTLSSCQHCFSPGLLWCLLLDSLAPSVSAPWPPHQLLSHIHITHIL